MSDKITEAEATALRYMADAGGAIDIDMAEGVEAAAAALMCLGLAHKGMCRHTKIGPRVAHFDITLMGSHVAAGGIVQ